MSLLTCFYFMVFNTKNYKTLKYASRLFNAWTLVITLIYFLGFISYLIYQINIKKVLTEKIPQKSYRLITTFNKNNSFINRNYYILIFLKKIIISMILVFFYKQPKLQMSLIALINFIFFV